MQLGVLQGRVGVLEGQCGLPSMYWVQLGVRRCVGVCWNWRTGFRSPGAALITLNIIVNHHTPP